MSDENRLRVAICDDSPSDAEALTAAIAASKQTAATVIFSSGRQLLDSFPVGGYDLIVMDIYLGEESGLDVVGAIKKFDPLVPIAFMTSGGDNALASYRLGAIRYLEKPVSVEAVDELLELAQLINQRRPGLDVIVGRQSVHIPFCRIEYIEQQLKHAVIHLADGASQKISLRLDDVEQHLAAAQTDFFRPHHSYLVNFAYVVRLDRELSVFAMRSGSFAHISRDLLKKAKIAYEEFLFRDLRRSSGK